MVVGLAADYPSAYLQIGTALQSGRDKLILVALNIRYMTSAAVSGMLGTGTVNRLAKFTATNSIGDSGIIDDGTNITTSENIRIDSDTRKVVLGDGQDMTVWYDGTDGNIKTDDTAPSDLQIHTGANKTIELQTSVWDDLRIVPGSFDRPGIADPDYVIYYPNGGGLGVYLPEFAKNDFACFIVQMPHSYKEGSNIFIHVHWTPGTRGNEESGATVGWKIDYSWANIGDNFGDMQTADLSDACDGTDHKHQMSPDIEISGVGKHISSMLMCNIRRSDTGTDDTWAGTASGELPLLLEVDIHYESETIGSRQRTAK